MLRLIFEFLKTGLFSVGGGLATIPFLVKMGEKYGYFTNDELITMIAVSESTPGAIGINMATFAGLKANGVLGGVVATISLVIPSLVIILVIAKLIDKYRNNKYTSAILNALKPVSIGLIIAAIIPIYISLFKGTDAIWSVVTVLLFGAVFLIREKFKKIHPAFIIFGAFFIGIIMDFFIR